MTETMTTSSTGGAKAIKEERYDLLPVEALDALARVYSFGARKYADHNWRRGYEFSKSYAAAMRHMTAFWRGETNDPESGLPHPAHAMFHMAALLTWLEEGEEGGRFDDRYAVQAERERYPAISVQGPRAEWDWRALLRERTINDARNAGLLYPEFKKPEQSEAERVKQMIDDTRAAEVRNGWL